MLTISTLFLYISLFTVVFSARPSDRPVDRNKLPYKVICYWGTWAFYRSSFGKFQAEDINPNLCTQINYGFAKLDQHNKIALYDPDLDYGDTDWTSGLPWGHGMIRRMTNLRNYNSNLTTLIAIGGWNEGSNKYSAMAQDPSKRAVFIQSVLDFLDFHNLDGLDLDWEYPTMAANSDEARVHGREQDRADFLSLVRELRAAFQPYGYILSAALSAGEPTASRAYEFVQLSQNLDSLNLMTYDFHGSWDSVTGHNAPLYNKPGAVGIDKQFTTSYAIQYYLNKGVDPKKLIVGIPLYGRTFTLSSASSNGYGAPTHGAGNAGPVTNIQGMMGYNEICSKNEFTRVFDADIKSPYKHSANQWIGYDDVESVGHKVDYALSKGLGGALIWSVDTDDFTGRCGSKFPLLKVISGKLNKITGPDTRIPITHYHSILNIPNKPINKPTNPIKQEDNKDHSKHDRKPNSPIPKAFVCKNEGYFKDPINEKVFHQCVNIGTDKLHDYISTCPFNTVFNDSIKNCVHK